MIRRYFIALTAMLIAVSTGAETPREVWVKSKCALCHGIEGSGQTDAGRQVKAPDLRATKTQKLSDEALAKTIAAGHQKMPAFLRSVSAERQRLVITYIRSLVKTPPPPPAPRRK